MAGQRPACWTRKDGLALRLQCKAPRDGGQASERRRRPVRGIRHPALRRALREAESIRAVAKATSVQYASLVRFVNGRQSLRLDMADKLAAYFGIECRGRTRA